MILVPSLFCRDFLLRKLLKKYEKFYLIYMFLSKNELNLSKRKRAYFF